MKSGMTLIEVLCALALMGVITIIMIPFTLAGMAFSRNTQAAAQFVLDRPHLIHTIEATLSGGTILSQSILPDNSLSLTIRTRSGETIYLSGKNHPWHDAFFPWHIVSLKVSRYLNNEVQYQPRHTFLHIEVRHLQDPSRTYSLPIRMHTLH